MTLVIAQKFNFEKLLDSISRYRITHLMIVPPMAVLFCKVLDYFGHQVFSLTAHLQHPSVKKYDLSSIRLCMVAAAPMSADLTEQLLQALPNIHLGQGYGLSFVS
jgi:acyl-CoA synthetase (AMP-forming)/AMP-acid ligase II